VTPTKIRMSPVDGHCDLDHVLLSELDRHAVPSGLALQPCVVARIALNSSRLDRIQQHEVVGHRQRRRRRGDPS
jgi:hypothetical protein